MWKSGEEKNKEEEEVEMGSKEEDMGDRQECIAGAGKDEDGEAEHGSGNNIDGEEIRDNEDNPPSLQIDRKSQ